MVFEPGQNSGMSKPLSWDRQGRLTITHNVKYARILVSFVPSIFNELSFATRANTVRDIETLVKEVGGNMLWCSSSRVRFPSVPSRDSECLWILASCFFIHEHCWNCSGIKPRGRCAKMSAVTHTCCAYVAFLTPEMLPKRG